MVSNNYRRTHSRDTRIASYMLSLLLTLGAPVSFSQSSDQAGPELAGRVIVVSGANGITKSVITS